MTYEMRIVNDEAVELKFETADSKIKYVLIERYQAYVSDWPAEELEAKIDAATKAAISTDVDFFDMLDSFESYALDDCDATYFDDSEYKQQILDTLLFYVTNSKIDK